ncbi:MAG: hypothetical protein NTX49_06775 [Chlamydiae bacterium]|nr:hypothetical protein [Chlamydiota bacterium]
MHYQSPLAQKAPFLYGQEKRRYLMVMPIVSKKRAKAICSALFLVGLGIVGFTGNWWPGIMLAIGIPLALRQYLLRKPYDVFVTLLIFVGVFVTAQFNNSWNIIMPVMFTVGGIYVFFRDYIESKLSPEPETEENINEEIEEEQHPR